MHDASKITIRVAAHFIQISNVSLNAHKIVSIKTRTVPQEYPTTRKRGLSELIITSESGVYDCWEFGNEATKDQVLIDRYRKEADKLHDRIMDALELLTLYEYNPDAAGPPD